MGSEAPRVQIKTSLGTFEVELYTKHCPKTCRNFLELSRKGYYNNTVVRPSYISRSRSSGRMQGWFSCCCSSSLHLHPVGRDAP